MREIIRINENTWRIEDGFVRFFLLEGDERAVLIDSGATENNAREIAESLTAKPIVLLNTHGDGDHTAGNAAFEQVKMLRADYENCRMGQKYPDCRLAELHDGEIIDLGGRKLEIISIPGHTCGSAALLDISARVLYSGDSVQSGHIFMFGRHRAPELFEAALEKLISQRERYDLICPSHDSPELPADYVEKVLAGWRRVLSGELNWFETDVHGNNVKCYETEYCGFYCDK